MGQEVFSSASQHKHLSQAQLRMQQKKALQSYRHIASIKAAADNEQALSKKEAEDQLKDFIILGADHGK